MKTFLLLCALSFISLGCSSNSTQCQVVNEFVKQTLTYEYHENDELAILTFTSVEFPLSIVYFKEAGSSYLLIHDSISQYIHLENRFNVERDINTKNLALYKDGDQFIFMYPTFSEEFPTFQLLAFNEKGNFKSMGTHTFSFEDVERLHINFAEATYYIEKTDTVPQIFLKSNPCVLLTVVYNDSMSLQKISKQDLERLRHAYKSDSFIEGYNDVNKTKIDLVNGEWQPNCEEPSGYFRTDGEIVELELRIGEVGAWMIFLDMKRGEAFDEVLLYFDRTNYVSLPMGAEGEEYNSPPSDKDISSKKVVGKLKIISEDKFQLMWYGLYHRTSLEVLDEYDLTFERDAEGSILLRVCEK